MEPHEQVPDLSEEPGRFSCAGEIRDSASDRADHPERAGMSCETYA